MWILNFRYASITAVMLASGLAVSCATAAEVQAPAQDSKTVSSEDRSQEQRFAAWKTDFMARAIAKGYEPALVTSLITPAKINPLALDRDKKQPEFNSPIWAYVDKTRSPDRVARGKAKLDEHAALFRDIEARYRVSPYILTAIWGLESSYGRIMGDYDIINALSTFAFEGRRTAFGEEQLFATLDILTSGKVTQSQLKSSWAGAMGMTQFIPTTFRDYAVDFDGNGNKDLWNSEADALGSAAHYLSRFGWRLGEPVFIEVNLPDRFDYTQADGRKASINDWVAKGVSEVNGKNFSAEAGFLEARLLVPAGANGPKLLAFKNFDVIMRYNKSTSYAMGIAMLADAFADKPGLVNDWPREDKQVGRTELMDMQKKLTALGYDTGGADGIVGPNTRRAIRSWQTANGLIADGYIERKMFTQIMGSK